MNNLKHQVFTYSRTIFVTLTWSSTHFIFIGNGQNFQLLEDYIQALTLYSALLYSLVQVQIKMYSPKFEFIKRLTVLKAVDAINDLSLMTFSRDEMVYLSYDSVDKCRSDSAIIMYLIYVEI